MRPSTSYLHKASSIWADLGSGLRGFLPDLCSYFAERPQALFTIWCTPAQTHPLWGDLHKRKKSGFLAQLILIMFDRFDLKDLFQSGHAHIDHQSRRGTSQTPAERSSYFWDCCGFRSHYCVTQGRDFSFLRSELSAEWMCPCGGRGRTYLMLTLALWQPHVPSDCCWSAHCLQRTGCLHFTSWNSWCQSVRGGKSIAADATAWSNYLFAEPSTSVKLCVLAQHICSLKR